MTVATITGNQITYTGTLSGTVQPGSLVTFGNSGVPLVYAVAGVNTTSKIIDFTIAIDPTVTAGATVYQFVNGSSSPVVFGLQDVSTGVVDTNINGYINIYLYNNGSSSPVNSSSSAITVMSASGLSYQWDSTKLMSNTCFAILHLTYNANAGITSIQQTQFEVINPRNSAGDVIYDYLSSTVYGAAIPTSQIDTASIATLNTYCNQTITFNNYLGVALTQPRFKMNGAIDTSQTVLGNIQGIASCCDCLIKYNEIYGTWSAITQSPAYTVAMDLNDSNMVSNLSITSMDIANTYNIAQCQFPDITLNSSFNTSSINLALVNPSLLYPNEPQNSQSVQLPLCNNDVQAQLIATRFLEQARLDLQVTCQVNYIGLELEAGDVVTVTNANYGWTAKLFQIFKAEQNFAADGAITVSLTLQEFDPNAFSDGSITQYVPPSRTGLGNPIVFGTIPAPVVSNILPLQASVTVTVTTSSQGIVQYANLFYSAYAAPTTSQLTYIGTTVVEPAGLSYGNNVAMPPLVLVGDIPAGSWYFFSQMANSLGISSLSPPSTVLTWSPAILNISIVGFLTNESVTIAADSTGYVASFSTCGGTFKVYNGTTDVTGSAVTYSVVSSTGVTIGIATTGIYTITAMSANSGTATLQAVYGGVTITKIYTIAKAIAGVTGGTGAAGSQYSTAYLYQWATTTPGNPNSTSTFTWATGTNAGYLGTNSWVTTVPANPGTPGILLWVASIQITAAGGTTTSTVSWASGFSVYAASLNGIAGTQTANPGVYQWALTIPSGPTGTATYTWSTGGISSIPTGWAATPGTAPSAGYTLWEAKVHLLDSASNSTTSINWTTAVISAQGYAGANGATGGTGTTGNSYRLAYAVVPSSETPGGTTTVTTSGSSSFPTSGTWFSPTSETWSSSPGSLGSNQTLYQLDGIYSPTSGNTVWSGPPYISALKVGSLSAITANTGTLNVTGTITSGSSPLPVATTMSGSGFYVDSSGYFALGNATDNITNTSGGLTVNGQIIGTTNIVNAAVGTLQVAGGSVTAMTYSFTASVNLEGSVGGVYPNTGGPFTDYCPWITLSTISITMSAGSTGCIVNATLTATSNGPKLIGILKGGTLLSYVTLGSGGYLSIALTAFDSSPTTGTNTYTLAFSASSITNPMTVTGYAMQNSMTVVGGQR